MATALEQAAERLSPAPVSTNYLDPAAGADVIARYANARIGAESSALAADAASRLERSREGRLAGRQRAEMFQREKTLWDREDQEYQARQDFKSRRGEFLDSISAIDPEAEDFEAQISELHRKLPPEALNDDAVSALVAWKQKVYQDRLNERDMQARRAEAFEDRLALQRERYANDRRLDVLSPEERQQFVGPDGSFDSVGAAQLAFQKNRQLKMEDFNAKQDRRMADRLFLSNLQGSAAEERDMVEDALTDTAAFPRQVSNLMREVDPEGKMTRTKIREKFRDRYEEAAEQDRDTLGFELDRARGMDEDEYVSRVSGLDDEAREKRRALWRFANGSGRAPATPEPAAAPAAPPMPSIGDEMDGYIFLGGNPAEQKNWRKKE